jgi:hypothetical protein
LGNFRKLGHFDTNFPKINWNYFYRKRTGLHLT